MQLTPCEFEIMEVLWQVGSGTVRDVHAALHPTRGLAYTTIMTVMEKLHRKGALSQRRQGRAYLYTVQISQEEALHQRIDHLVKHYFQGSPERFLDYLRREFESSKATSEQASASGAEIDTTLL